MDEKKELLIPEDLEGIEISEEEMPGIISQQFDKIVEIDKRIAVAEEKCASSKALAEKQVAAKGIHKSEAITTTQNAVRSLVDQPVEEIDERSYHEVENGYLNRFAINRPKNTAISVVRKIKK